MFFKKTRTKKLIKNRYTKARRALHTDSRLEVWDSTLLQWVFYLDIIDSLPDADYAYNAFDSMCTVEVPSTEALDSVSEPLSSPEPLVTAIENTRETYINSGYESSSHDARHNDGYDSDSSSSGFDSGYSSSGFDSGSTSGGFGGFD